MNVGASPKMEAPFLSFQDLLENNG
jgi:hypothetical protein